MRDLRLKLYADLVLICDDGNTGNKVFQIWINQKGSGFKLQQSGKLPTGIQSISFADIGTHQPYCNTVAFETQGLQTETGLSIWSSQLARLSRNQLVSEAIAM